MISLADVYGANVDGRDKNTWYLHALPTQAPFKHEDRDFKFKCEAPALAAAWVDAVRHLLAGVPPGGLFICLY